MRLRGRIAALLASATVAFGGVGGPVTAAASPASVTPVATAPAPVTEAIGLSWDGTRFGTSTTETFVGFPVTVPGDSASRSLAVRNDGPSDGVLQVHIANVDLRNPGARDVHHNRQHTAPDDSGHYGGAGDQGDFYSDLLIRWDQGAASIKDLDAVGRTQILTTPLPRGEVTTVTIGYELPLDSRAGNRANVDTREGRFDVILDLGDETTTGNSGDDGNTGDSGSTNSGHDASASSDGEDTGADADSGAGSGRDADAGGDGTGQPTTGFPSGESDPLPRTGGLMWWFGVLGVLLTGAGAAIAVAARKRSSASAPPGHANSE